ncbi:MAG TPA: 2-dehydropantoate 2-reductase [Candidatus Dormibacteraeota bacterium]|nr:2-dehydropantoate 2-reductase [Candidatus Dormibacteraeota bacterium]
MTGIQRGREKLRVTVVGAGAIGAVAAEAAAAAGHEVTLGVRTPIDRLVVETDGVAREVPLRVASDPAQVEGADWVLLAVKGQDSAAAAPWLARLSGPETPVAVLQNGVDHEERVRRLAPAAPVLPVLVYIAAERLGPGRVVHRLGGRFQVPAGDLALRFRDLMSGGGMEVEPVDDFLTAAWRKLLGNVAANPLTALTESRIGVMRDPSMGELARGLLEEAVEIGRAEGARLEPDDIDRTMEDFAGYPPDSGSSMLYDRIARRPLEHELITGAVVRAADRHGIAAPRNRTILALLRALDQSLRSASGGRPQT